MLKFRSNHLRNQFLWIRYTSWFISSTIISTTHRVDLPRVCSLCFTLISLFLRGCRFRVRGGVLVCGIILILGLFCSLSLCLLGLCGVIADDLTIHLDVRLRCRLLSIDRWCWLGAIWGRRGWTCFYPNRILFAEGRVLFWTWCCRWRRAGWCCEFVRTCW